MREPAAVWTAYQGLVSLGVMSVVMGAAWLRIAFGARAPEETRAPERWYTTHHPPAFLLPDRWDLAELRRDFDPPGVAKRESAPQS